MDCRAMCGRASLIRPAEADEFLASGLLGWHTARRAGIPTTSVLGYDAQISRLAAGGIASMPHPAPSQKAVKLLEA